jgi:hypothetical protein
MFEVEGNDQRDGRWENSGREFRNLMNMTQNRATWPWEPFRRLFPRIAGHRDEESWSHSHLGRELLL